MRWTFLYCAKAYIRVGVWGREWYPIQALSEAGGLLQNAIYIYIYTQNSIFGRSKKERFLDRFLMIFLYRFKARLEGLEGIRVGF